MSAPQDEEGAGNIAYQIAREWSQRYNDWTQMYADTTPLAAGPSSFVFDTATVNSLFRHPSVEALRLYFGMEEVDDEYNLKVMMVGVVGEVSEDNYGRDSLELGVFTFSESLSWTTEYVSLLVEDNPWQFSQSNYERVYLDTIEGTLRPPGRPLINENGAEGPGSYNLSLELARAWANGFGTTFRQQLANYPLNGDTVGSPCSFMFSREHLINGLDYDTAQNRFNNPVRANFGVDGTGSVVLYLTLANQIGNGDIFNSAPDVVYSKILDYARPCPPRCGTQLLYECEVR